MSEIQNKILEFTKSKDIDESLTMIFSEYLKFKTFYLKSEISRFELKWGVSFDELKQIFEHKSIPKTEEIEQDIEEWELLIDELDYFINYQKNEIIK